MQINIANNAGACYGVNRSLDIVKDAASKYTNIATLGDLIHNPAVVKDLRDKYSIKSVESVSQAVESGIEVLIIRSHGVSLDVIDQAKSAGIKIIDATCPYVKNVQNTAMILAGLYPAVIIIGKLGHPEIESVASYVKAQSTKCFIVQTKQEIDRILPELKSINDSIGVVSQTTQSAPVFDEIVDYLSSQGIKLEIENTICASTKKRQNAAIELSKKSQAMIVLGGKNSSNTNHLADLCKDNCEHVYHIETANELNPKWLENVSNLGITAGASTPKEHIEKLLSYLN